MIEYIVVALMCLMMLITIAYTAILIIFAIKQHRVRMRIDKGIAEALKKRLIELDGDAEENTAQDNVDQEDVNGEL